MANEVGRKDNSLNNSDSKEISILDSQRSLAGNKELLPKLESQYSQDISSLYAESDKEIFIEGTVKWFNNVKGFGFIEHPTGEDVFVHYSVIESNGFKTLREGEKVMYSLRQGGKGLYASSVKKLASQGRSKYTRSSSSSIRDSIKVDRVKRDNNHI